MSDEKGTELIESPKRVAADGTQRGLKRLGSKNRSTQLLEDIQRSVESVTGIKNWDPVVMMAVVAAQALTGYPAVDEEGRPILDANGNQVMVPPDRALAVAAAAKVAPYVHQQLRPKDVGDDADDKEATDARQKTIEMAEALGFKADILKDPS